MIEITSKVDLIKSHFEQLLYNFTEALPSYTFKPENVDITSRKLEIKVDLAHVDRVKEIVEAIRQNFPPGLQVALSTNTLEKAYLEIEKKNDGNEGSFSTEKVNQMMDDLFRNKPIGGITFLNSLRLIIRNKFSFLIQNTFELVKMVELFKGKLGRG